MLEVQQNKTADDNSAAVQTVDAASITVLAGLIAAWMLAKERYADLHSRARTPAANQLIARIRDDIETLEGKVGSRVRKRREKSGAKFSDAIERFVGDLLRAKAGMSGPVRIYRAVGKTGFEHDPVKYDMFTRVLEGLKALELVGHLKGTTRYRKSEVGSVTLPGRAARFWATGKLLGLAEHYGINSGNVGEHFAPEPPRNPSGAERLRDRTRTQQRARP